MNYRKVTAIIRCNVLEKVETVLQAMGVRGISVTKVKGYGEYTDFHSGNWVTSHSRIEIFTDESQAEPIAQAIMNTAHAGTEGDGIIAILPVERLYRVRTRSAATMSEI